jgi:mRNA-degrading endonuclease RelE of RelBE toxin-antitoxin system
MGEVHAQDITERRYTLRGLLVRCTALPYNPRMEFIETSLFTDLLYTYLTEDEFRELQDYLVKHPQAGNVVPGSGGVRKLRWAAGGKGKSGGVRVIYYYKHQDSEIWLLTLYSKSVRENIAAHVLRQIAEEIKNA